MEILMFGFVLLFFLSLLFRGKRKDVLYCGLFGFAGYPDVPVSAAVKQKLITLGLINESRGGDGCGYYNGEILKKGIDKEKRFHDFVISNGIEDGNGFNNVFIGHVRKSSVGSHTVNNTHPFLIQELIPQDNKTSVLENKLVLAHNGTISNIWSLCTDHGIKHNGIFVDSLGLAEIIAKDGWDVLKEYKGYAALLVHKIDEPNVLYAFHGESKETEKGLVQEERPLWFLRTKEGIYFSSIDWALGTIKESRDGDVKPERLPCNKIIRVKDGEIFDTGIEINREDANLSKSITYSYGYGNNYGVFSYGSEEYGDEMGWKKDYEWKKGIWQKKKPFAALPNSTTYGGTSAVRKGTELKIFSVKCADINEEALPPSAFEHNVVYYHKSRFWYSDTLLNGQCFINKKQRTLEEAEDTCNRVEAFYFYEGVMFKDRAAYEAWNNALKDENSAIYFEINNPLLNFAEVISNFSRYPVCSTEPRDATNTRHWYWNDKKAINGFRPILSDRNYHFDKEGLLIKIGTFDTKDTVLVLGQTQSKGGAEVNNTKEFPDEIYKAEEFFRKVYVSSEEAHSNMTVLCMEALYAYSEDFIEDVLGMTKVTGDLIESFVEDLINNAVKQKSTIEELMDPRCADVQSLLIDAYDELNNSEEDGIERKEDGLEPFISDEAEACPMMPEGEKVVYLKTDPGHQKLNGEFHNGEIFQEAEIIEDTEAPKENIDKLIEDENAMQFVEQFVKNLEKLRKEAEVFQILQESDFAQDVYSDITNHIDNLKQALKQTFKDYKMTQLVEEVRKTMTESFYS